MRMEEGLDTGPFALQVQVDMGERSAAEVENLLARAGADALLEVIREIATGTVIWTQQDESLATYARKVTKDDVALRPELTVTEALLRVRASGRHAPARACLGDRELTVLQAERSPAELPPGAICVIDGIPVLGLIDGSMALTSVRPAGRGDMPAADWIRGVKITEDACWRCTR